MITDRDTDRLLKRWFQEDDDALPDHVLDLVLVGLPSVPQARRPLVPLDLRLPRRSWARLALVAALLAALVAGLLAVGGFPVRPPARPFAADGPLDAGRYVVDTPFYVRFALDVPRGWSGAEYEGNSAVLERAGDAVGRLWFLAMDGLYRDPCRSDLGLDPTLGGTPDELATALARLAGVGASIVTHPVVGGRRAAAVTLLGRGDTRACTGGSVIVAGVPHTYELFPGERHRFWVLEIDGRRLVVSAVDSGAGSAAADDLDGMVASLEFGVAPVAGPPSTPRPSPSPSSREVILRLPLAGTPVGPGFYVFDLPVYDGTGGTLVRVPMRHEGALWIEAGWFATEQGVASDPGPDPGATIGIRTIARAYLDPCRWQESKLGTIPQPLLATSADLSRMLSAYWPPEPDPLVTRVGFVPPPFVPDASEPRTVAWNSKLAHRLDLTIPADLDVTACDGGEYRLWEDPSGSARQGRPGERIQLTIVDLDPGIITLDVATVPAASSADRDALQRMVDRAWAGIALEPAPPP